MHLVYFSHSYRPQDSDVNEFFQEIMVSNSMIISLDPPSDRLNSAKPERHLRSTDAMVVILPFRETGPSPYILYEVSLSVRAKKPVLVFIEDKLPDNLIPVGVLQCRFARRSLLRQIRGHQHALHSLKEYIGDNPPPPYQLSYFQRSCLILGTSHFPDNVQQAIANQLTFQQYRPFFLQYEGDSIVADTVLNRATIMANVAIVFFDSLTQDEYYVFGALRASLVPCIVFSFQHDYPFNASIPKEYQVRVIDSNIPDIISNILVEMDIFEEDYLDIKDADKVNKYRSALLEKGNEYGNYSSATRENVTNIVIGNNIGEIGMSSKNYKFGNVIGPVNIESRLENVNQIIQNAPALNKTESSELIKLISDLKTELAKLPVSRKDDYERVVKSTETIVNELKKEKPNKGFLNATVEGLKEAAKTVSDIAPAIVNISIHIAKFISVLGI